MNTSGFDIPHTGLRGEIRNEARDGSTVAQQIGVVYGTAVHNENVYHLEPGARPERRHEVARNFLVGGTPRPAEQILADLLREGEVTTERMYHYFLAVVSDRSFHDIKAEHVDLVSVARKTIALLGRDEWSDAFEVIWEFLTYARMRMQGEEEDNAAVLDAFKALPDARQEEIHLHLQMILSSADQAVLDATRAGRIAVERFSGDRTARAWKFFEPDPAPPRLSMPQATVLERGTWTRAVAGVLLLATALWSAVIGATGVGLAVSLPLLAVGIQLALRHGIVRRAGQAWKQARQSEVTPGPPEEAVSPGHWVPTAFVKDIHRMVDERFSQARPHQAGDWPRYIGGFREHLKRRLVAQYGNARVDASEIDWLINWHARRVASGWSAQELFRFPMPHEPRSTRLSALGIGLACLAIAILALNGALVAAVIIGLGGGLAVEAITHLAGLRRADALLLSDAKALFEQEQAAYEQRCQELADRPTDAEMARWLALDKIYLRNDAMRRAKLGEQDLVTHVVMTEGAQGARARVLNGPPRFARYIVQIFLLTRNGVREARVDLEFLSGKASDERRNLFRYEALASASVTEKGSRVTEVLGNVTRPVESLRSRTFRLTLVNGDAITVVAENFRKPEDDVIENDSDLFSAALQSSGIDTALPILEAVAAEGSHWIARDEERRVRWSRDWTS
ncbi:hypothetical protein [Actinoalloteichus hymeniacidonis]|uniref:Uncharacterized protein n=1 Tax=Actinoalloteichus hymeniacidonis TaxID=340345 RepID=A0AAC9HQW4_9PSEU|nr:hypothetical protein [Actinoalloteichus hymeniacidonis]AOS63775.1 hypothetical protein TL08_14830 [Actinoalloteichus hymeniacidonis]MBB5908171.1 hypothetical protein [Actinoalloteichus hymeniacidonis]